MVIEVSEEIRRITIREVVIGSYEQSAGMSDFLCLREIAILSSMYVIKDSGELPVICSIGDAFNPCDRARF